MHLVLDRAPAPTARRARRRHRGRPGLLPPARDHRLPGRARRTPTGSAPTSSSPARAACACGCAGRSSGTRRAATSSSPSSSSGARAAPSAGSVRPRSSSSTTAWSRTAPRRCSTRTCDAAGRPTAEHGLDMYARADLERFVRLCDAEGFGVHIHTIGDRAVRESLDALEAAMRANGRRDARHQLAHVQFAHPDDLPRFRRARRDRERDAAVGAARGVRDRADAAVRLGARRRRHVPVREHPARRRRARVRKRLVGLDPGSAAPARDRGRPRRSGGQRRRAAARRTSGSTSARRSPRRRSARPTPARSTRSRARSSRASWPTWSCSTATCSASTPRDYLERARAGDARRGRGRVRGARAPNSHPLRER